MNLGVDVISDVICPWCFIGKRRLEKAIAAHGEPVKMRSLPYQLNPTMPKEGMSRKEYRIRKFGSWERSLELDAKLIAVGETEGIQNEITLSGAQQPDAFLDAFRQVGGGKYLGEAPLR